MGTIHVVIMIVQQPGNSGQSLIWRYHICMCFICQAGCRWMYRPKVLSGFFTGHSVQKPETKDTGGVWLPPYCQSGPQSSPTTHAFIRLPGWWQPWQASTSLPYLSSVTYRVGQVGHWCSTNTNTLNPVVCQVTAVFSHLVNLSCLDFHRLFGVFAVWLDDETLQKQEVYLPSLPPEYEPHRLAQVMQRQQVSLSWFSIQVLLLFYGATFNFFLSQLSAGTLAGIRGPGAYAVWWERSSVSVGKGAEWADFLSGPNPRPQQQFQP